MSGEQQAGSGEVLISASVGTGTANAAVGCLGALALIALVVLGMNLVMSDLPDGIEALTPWFGVAAGFLAIVTFLVFRRARKRAELVRTPAGLVLRVDGEELARGPFDLVYGYQKVQIKVGVPRLTVLILGVLVDGRPVATFSEEWGIIHGLPDGWPDKWPQVPPGARHHYKVMMGKFCADLVRLAEAG